ncbi:MAG: cytochrome c biogenesis protein CcsA [Alphaproteobacteria bacterium]
MSLFHYFFILSLGSSKLTLVTSLLIVITFFVFFVLSLFSGQFVRLRILFIPFFFSLLIFRSFIGITLDDTLSNYQLFNNKFLVVHIITSLLSYSLITISLVTSFCIYVQDLYIKKMKYNKIINNFLPSMYESELLAVRFLYATIIFLIVSLITGLYYYIESGQNLIYFLSEKVVLSIITLILTFIIILIRVFRGISGQMIF